MQTEYCPNFLPVNDIAEHQIYGQCKNASVPIALDQ